jgi:hypothetical protein
VRVCGIAVVLVLVATALAGAAEPKPPPTCSSGFVVVRDGHLTIIGMVRRGDLRLYACLGHGRPYEVGDDDTYIITFDGTRYLGELSIAIGGEGPADASYFVDDLRARRFVTYVPSVDTPDEIDPFRVTAAGALARDDYGIQLVRPGFRGDARLIKPLGVGNELAYTGTTLYWTDPTGNGSVARSATVGGAVAPQTHVYDLRALDVGALNHRRGRCARLRGRVVAASPLVRVVARGGVRRACAIGRRWVRALGPGALRIAGDRWLLRMTTDRAELIDARNGRVALAVPGGMREVAMGEYGALAWLDPGGRLLGWLGSSPGHPPTVLAEATDAPTALAASDRSIYWTSAGSPHRW